MPGVLKSLERIIVRPVVHWLRPSRQRAAGAADPALEELVVALLCAERRRGGLQPPLPRGAGADLTNLVAGLFAPPAEEAGRSAPRPSVRTEERSATAA